VADDDSVLVRDVVWLEVCVVVIVVVCVLVRDEVCVVVATHDVSS